jgi:2,3-bisphosphoglycerate-independent phosphoglycerate mutase
MDELFIHRLIEPANTKMVLLVMDGLGGLPRERGGKTELETAFTPNMDALAGHSALGLSVPVAPGVTNGSGPGHLALFGYDPIEYEIGRGALEALGVDFDLYPDDVAARGNFCTIDAGGLMLDRRGGRIPNAAADELLEMLRGIRVEGAEIFLRRIKEHRFAFVMRAAGDNPPLGDGLTETDPLKTGLPLREVKALRPDSARAAGIANRFLAQAGEILKDQSPANMITLRGFAKLPVLPQYKDRFKLNAACVAVNGMYKGVARLAGMKVLDVEGVEIADEFSALEKYWPEYDFFYMHVKQTDTYGELGDFDAKVKIIEEVDRQFPRLMALNPDVVVIGGDHSSPAVLKSHSWHPVPLLVYGPYVREDLIAEFGERACSRGSIGVIPAREIMSLAMANAFRVAKYSP